jgi:hypothetical protein
MIQFLILSVLFTTQVFAEKQVTLLVSVSGNSRVLFQTKDTTKRLVDQFRRHYKGITLPLKIIGNANQEDLHRELMNSENEAIFWVSHANSFNKDDAFGNEDTIIDTDGNNVKDVFQKIHPSLRFVAVLGCRTAPIMDEFKQRGYYKENDQLLIYARAKKINGKKEIKNAINIFKKLPSSKPSFCPQREGYSLTISRKIDHKRGGSSIKIMNRDKFLGLFPSGAPGEIQEMNLYVPQPNNVHDLKLIIDSKSDSLDQITIKSEAFSGEWKVFSDANGRPLGVNQRIYRYSGPVAPTIPSEFYPPYQCE